MAIKQEANGKWRARYRGPDHKERSKRFDTKNEAKRWLSVEQANMIRGEWVDPRAAKRNFGAVAEQWLDVHGGKPSTIAGYRSVLDRHVLATYGNMPIGSVDRPMVRSWLASMNRTDLAASTVRNALNVVKAVFTFAIESDMIRSSPAARVKAPSAERQPLNIPTVEEVHALADEVDAEHRLLILLASYSGLRAGELYGLTVADIDTMRGAIHVRRSVTEVHGKLVSGTPKSGRTRTVSLPATIRDELIAHIAPVASDSGALVFSNSDGSPIRHSNFRHRHFVPACERLGLSCRFHDLRHFAAASAIAAGAHPRAIMERMGHGSITVTLDVYGSLLPGLDETLTNALDEQFRAASENGSRPNRVHGADVVALSGT